MTIPMHWIKLRCRTDEDTGCLLWRQRVSKSGAPVTTWRVADGRKPMYQLRRVAWEHRNGPIPEGMVVASSCGHARCLMHLELIDRAELMRRQWEKPEHRAKLIAGMTKTHRERSAKVSIEIARAIRQSDDTLEVEAARYGISVALVSLIRRGQRWREDANPFAGLGSRA